MLDRKVFNYLDRLLRDVCSNNLPFGGKTIVVGGDFHQLPPVVPQGNRQDQISASIKNDPLFKQNFTELK
jgi:hypothetical protein